MAWTLCTTQPNSELRVARRLDLHREKFNIDVFLPKIIHRYCHHGNLRSALRPAYPRYLWLKNCLGAFYDLRSVFGVTEFLKTGDIVDRSVMALMAVCPDGVLPTPEPESPFHKDDVVLIRSLSGQPAVFDRALNEAEAIVLVEWLGRSVPTTVSFDDLIKRPDLIPSSPKPRRKRHRRRKHRHSSAPAPSQP